MNPGISLMRGTKPSSTSCPAFLGSVTPSYRRTATYIAFALPPTYPVFSLISGLTLSTDKRDASCHSSAQLPMHYLLRCSAERTSENTPCRELGEQRQLGSRS